MQSPDRKPSLIERCSHWWQNLGAWQQEMIATIAPLMAVCLFLLATFTAFLYLKSEERARETQSLRRESDLASQRLAATLRQHQENLALLASELGAKNDSAWFAGKARGLLAQHSELRAIAWVDANAVPRESIAAASIAGFDDRQADTPWPGIDLTAKPAPQWSVQQADGFPVEDPNTPNLFLQLATPVQTKARNVQWLVLVLSPEALLQTIAPANAASPSYRMALLGAQQAPPEIPREPAAGSPFGIALFSQDWLLPAQLRLPIAPFGEQLQLQASFYRTDPSLIDHALIWLFVILGSTTIALLVLNWRQSRRRFQAQRQLQEESNFRRAIEDAMTSGIRVLNMQGRTIYVNATFSRMVGWSQDELAGTAPPYPYWPDEDRDILLERFNAEIAGKHYPNGLQLRMLRKNGSLFDARIFITPLLNDAKQQTGWLTTINDITEPNKIRQQLAAAQDRITLVLESLDASISVAPLGSRELLFANRLYRQWFDSDIAGHLKLIARAGTVQTRQPDASAEDEDGLMGLPTEKITNAGSEHAEIHIERLDKWLEVRSRYLDWIDGRLAQMVIATDITARKQAEEQAARQAEHAQSVSRLITMGEMASSVAHELNQPLAAISNYTGGMISRIKAGSITLDELLPPLEKTAHQAVRAGQVILRIREFVKRSAPNRERCDAARLVGEAVEIASIELRRRDVRLASFVAARLPPLLVDAILIEQVLINLLKNAAEAVDGSQAPPERRVIELRVGAIDQGIGFSIQDNGPGIPEDQVARLFDAFYSTKKDGLGIGLNLCRSIVESHQGKIRVRNLYNAGALTGCEFSFWLPQAGPAAHHQLVAKPA